MEICYNNSQWDPIRVSARKIKCSSMHLLKMLLMCINAVGCVKKRHAPKCIHKMQAILSLCIPDRLTEQTTSRPNKRRKIRIRTWAEHSRLRGRPPLMGTLGVHQNTPASDTKLMHSLGIYSIGPPLVMDKLIPVNSREITSPPEMGTLLDVECKPAVIIKPRFILVTHMDHLNRNKTFN